MGVSFGQSRLPQEEKTLPEGQRRRSRKDYGSMSRTDTTDCPTCQGTGRIPRGLESQLVAVIPCSDQRLGPRHTKRYVCLSVTLCLIACMLLLFFLFPRTVSLSPVAVQSVFVYFSPDTVNMTITNVINISNENFVGVEAHDLEIQAVINDIVVGKGKIHNVTKVKPRSETAYMYAIDVSVSDTGLVAYCQSTSIMIRSLFLILKITMSVYYLAHSEELTMDTYEYINCGVNSTVPHIIHTS